VRLAYVLRLSVLALAVATRLGAQRLAGVVPGRQVRLVTVDGTVVTGEFAGVRSDTALIAMAHVVRASREHGPDLECVAQAIAISEIGSYAIQAREKTWAIYGTLVGGGLGLTLLSVARANDRRWDREGIGGPAPSLRKLAGPAALALTGAGALVGAFIGPKTWVAPSGARATVLAQPRSVGMAVSVPF
jgi:hypothetical protein